MSSIFTQPARERLGNKQNAIVSKIMGKFDDGKTLAFTGRAEVDRLVYDRETLKIIEGS